ncbi:ZIP family metal transporter [Streptococcus sp. X13SY08]|uniref:ZIP family metal transporter n=1 Tax=Streptococcus sp. X13SY08 TaxID=1676616 RepID=UPI00066FE7A0|nr:ZIP family metal transporter [Streptococcus sp. X13SY08]
MSWFEHQSVILQALLAGLFTWSCTIVGSAIVFFFKRVSRRLLDVMMGFAAGVMIATSFWSLLAPSIEYAEPAYGKFSWIPAAVGSLLGGYFLRFIDAVVPHLHLDKEKADAEGGGTKERKRLSKTALLFFANNYTTAAYIGALGLAIGIGLQNIPEGAALSIPIRTDGKSRKQAFFWGAMSAVVEPIAAVIGAFAVIAMTPILPYALSFAAGAMIFVVVEELIPESQTNGNTDLATLGLMAGFVIMMILDVALG